jgi:hypothetical protein
LVPGGAEVLVAYLLGPLSSALWLRGPARVAWSVAGALSALAVLGFLLRADLFSVGLASTPLGAAPWLVAVPSSLLALFLVWSRAVGAAGRMSTAPERPRAPWLIGALGLLVPGLGHQLLGRPRRAARAFLLLGPLTASVAVMANWRWLWFRNLTADRPLLSAPALELVFVAAALAAAAAGAHWISEAVDGARCARPATSRSRQDVGGPALLAALILLLAAFRPPSAARCLDQAAVQLTMSGLTAVPLALSEAAARLDPSEPRYLARALRLDEAMGRDVAAVAKREILEARTRAHLEVVWAEGNGLRGGAPARPAAGESPDRTGPQTALR